jgi:hypothetical protein
VISCGPVRTSRSILGGLIVSVAMTTGTYAGGFCDGLAQIGDTLAQPAQIPDQSFALPAHTAAQAGCQTSLSIGGGRSLHCRWSFAYRAPAATQAFDTLLHDIAACGAQNVEQDQDVNHPDFYDLHVFSFADNTVGVSLKDKGAISQTLVFLTFNAATAP